MCYQHGCEGQQKSSLFDARDIFIKLYPTYLTAISCTLHQIVAELTYIPSVQEASPPHKLDNVQ